jgi:signal transduction histidine kinase
MAKVFSSGFSTKDNHSGLGLAVVKDLVERNGGEISLRSSEEDGTTFSVIIPVK